MSLIETRGHQLFPVLDAGQTETVKRFASGPARAFAPGEVVFYVGQRHSAAWLVLKGSPGGNRSPVAARVRKAASRSRSTRRMCVP